MAGFFIDVPDGVDLDAVRAVVAKEINRQCADNRNLSHATLALDDDGCLKTWLRAAFVDEIAPIVRASVYINRGISISHDQELFKFGWPYVLKDGRRPVFMRGAKGISQFSEISILKRYLRMKAYTCTDYREHAKNMDDIRSRFGNRHSWLYSTKVEGPYDSWFQWIGGHCVHGDLEPSQKQLINRMAGLVEQAGRAEARILAASLVAERARQSRPPEPPPRVFSADEIETAKSMAEQKLSVGRIAQALNTTVAPLEKMCRSEKIRIFDAQQYLSTLLRVLYDAGTREITVAQLADMAMTRDGVSKEYVFSNLSWLERNGMIRRGPRKVIFILGRRN